MSAWHHAAIGFGGNLGDTPATLAAARATLHAHAQVRVIASSSLYRSAPIGPAGQPDYANAVVTIETELTPEALLDLLQSIELAAGRQRAIRWDARTLDLDILLYGHATVQTARLNIPHPELTRRAFVLVPLAEISPHLILPNDQSLSALVGMCARRGLAIWPDARW